MCVYSMVTDHYFEKWQPYRQSPYNPSPQMPSQDELDEFKRLLDRAREYDKRNNEPTCELEEKKQRVRELAKELGVEVAFL